LFDLLFVCLAMADGRIERQVITVDAKTADDANRDVGQVRLLSESLAGMDV
jgi:hypothetical protein